MGKVRTSDLDPTDSLLDCLQITQNKFARFLNGNKLNDRVPTESTLKDLKMLSVNQLNAQIKITEIWKAMHDPNHPLKIQKVNHESSV